MVNAIAEAMCSAPPAVQAMGDANKGRARSEWEVQAAPQENRFDVSRKGDALQLQSPIASITYPGQVKPVFLGGMHGLVSFLEELETVEPKLMW